MQVVFGLSCWRSDRLRVRVFRSKMFRRSRFSVRPNVGTAGRTAATPQESPAAKQETGGTAKEASEGSCVPDESNAPPLEKNPTSGWVTAVLKRRDRVLSLGCNVLCNVSGTALTRTVMAPTPQQPSKGGNAFPSSLKLHRVALPLPRGLQSPPSKPPLRPSVKHLPLRWRNHQHPAKLGPLQPPTDSCPQGLEGTLITANSTSRNPNSLLRPLKLQLFLWLKTHLSKLLRQQTAARNRKAHHGVTLKKLPPECLIKFLLLFPTRQPQKFRRKPELWCRPKLRDHCRRQHFTWADSSTALWMCSGWWKHRSSESCSGGRGAKKRWGFFF